MIDSAILESVDTLEVAQAARAAGAPITMANFIKRERIFNPLRQVIGLLHKFSDYRINKKK